jgi:hypothetical protein
MGCSRNRHLVDEAPDIDRKFSLTLTTQDFAYCAPLTFHRFSCLQQSLFAELGLQIAICKHADGQFSAITVASRLPALLSTKYSVNLIDSVLAAHSTLGGIRRDAQQS